MRIRPAVADDAPAIAALEQTDPVWIRALLGLIARGRDRGQLFVAIDGTETVGYGRCGWRSHPGEGLPAGWYLQGCRVAPQARRRGAGRALVEARLRWLRDARGARVVWSQAADTAAARALHARCGFTPAGGALLRYDAEPR